MHGRTALLGAINTEHGAIMNLLLEHKTEFCMPDRLAASVLYQAVFDGDIVLFERLLKAGIDVNACDYDRCSSAMIDTAEGNVADNGADLTLKDR